jgi:hypothetical protein
MVWPATFRLPHPRAIGRRDDSHKTHYSVNENKVAKLACQKRRMGVLNWV